MKKQKINILLLSLLCTLVTCASLVYARQEPVDKIDQGPLIETLNVKRLSMRQFARLLSQGCGWKIVVSQGASKVEVSIYLERVHTDAALKAVCQSYNLWYKKDPVSGIISIITLDEYQKGVRIYSDEAIEVITLRYPDARAVGDALQRLFRDRVVWQRPDDEENDPIEDVELALERMDALADRAKFSQDNTGGYNGGDRNNRSTSSRLSSRYDSRSSRDSRNSDSRYSRNRSSSTSMTEENKIVEDIQREVAAELLLEKLSYFQEQPVAGRIDQPGVVYVSAFRGTNDLLLRSSDPESLKEIIKVVRQLDKPKPQVLLEVKVLDITLDDEDARGIDWLFNAGDFSGGRSTGINSTGFGGSYGQIKSPSIGLVPQGTGLDPRATVLQVVTDNVLGRIQMLEDRNRVTRLATPTLCVADNEASRIFVGTETTILKSVDVQQSTTSGNNPVTTISTNPETDRQNIGTTLLITPRIHADRTATIRIVQEDSRLGSIQTIRFGEDGSFQSQDIETRSVVTTVVAADGEISVIGGLIREEVGKRDVGIPSLMDLPLIGSLFKTQFENRERHELLVLIRPFILLAPGEAEPVSKALLQRLSEHPSARGDIPAMRIGQGDFLLVNEKLYRIPSQALNAITQSAAVWATE